MHLVAGTNHQGYQSALIKAFDDLGDVLSVPVKSSLCKYRKKISFMFFRDKLDDLILAAQPFRKTFRGFYIYAIDGQETPIPFSEKFIDLGFKGRAREHDMETYYPRLYLSHLFDVVNEFTTGVVPSSDRNENRDAVELLEKTESNSIILYDRAYISRNLLNAHVQKGNYFIFRCQSGSTFKPIIEFYHGTKKKDVWNFLGLKIRLIKLINPRTNEPIVFATNLFEEDFSDEEIGQLYLRRWSIETAFKDSVTQALEQWHSKDGNGLLQELYMHIWIMNFTRLHILSEQKQGVDDWLGPEYKKPNLKLLVEYLMGNIKLILKNQFRKLSRQVRRILKMTREHRKHHARSYPRVLKYSRKSFPTYNLVERR